MTVIYEQPQMKVKPLIKGLWGGRVVTGQCGGGGMKVKPPIKGLWGRVLTGQCGGWGPIKGLVVPGDP